ncbi:NAD(P)H-dependent flavin oxidoreductase [Stutzerimonas kirkiae]|uniref:Nitronate monooxygenase n=1 Tax=Stutzerimonas kirkiae TaxID=2211392 RepID=A0A4Q9REP8_9GAMM|nr:nitronate monooxygenase [Stutzerimonas kirkiae]TBU99295.1 2-nitropropane dioxygenase [Stutzerimonas kirkiae]TBV05127.1 2-nitropropane dioxygenase [Stutzerimonas kirkiae]TBV06245.1 2-nitropropane dioxygenase [Stutzerimonas kirkiae]
MTLEHLFDIPYPILQAPMAGAQDHRLAVAVSQAGGLGAIPAGMLDAARLDEQLSAYRALTERPCNVNFFCHQPPPIDDAREQRWRERLAGFYRELQVDPAQIARGPSRQPFDAAMAQIIEKHRPAVVSFHFGLPAQELLERVRRSGAKIIASATTLAEGLWLQERGVDAVIAQGLEAGGHRGMFLESDLSTQLGTFALLPQLADALELPVIAAGGIVDARTARAARVLGAAAVQVGTAYLATPQSLASELHRKALQDPRARHTVVTCAFSGRPARGIVNRLIREIGPLPDTPAFPLASNAITPLRARAESLGLDDFTPLWSGQNASQCRTVDAGQLTRELGEAASDKA